MINEPSLSLFCVQVITPEIPCRVTWDRYRQRQAPMSSELLQLLKEVEQLRKETDSLVCRCNQPSCPFHKSKSSPGSQTSLNSLTDFSQSSAEDEADSRLILRRLWTPPRMSESLHSKSTGNLTCIVPGVQRRSDGTIVEGDGPRYSIGQGTKMRRCGTYNGFTQANHLDIANCTIRETEDCTIDYENTFSAEGYEFSRQAPERKQFRSPKVQKRHSKLKNSVSYPVSSESPLSSSHKSSDSESLNGSPKPRGRSSSSPTVSTSRRHMSLDQGSPLRWKSGGGFDRSSQQA